MEYAKDIWETQQVKYKFKDARRKKFLVSQFLKFTVTNNKSILDQFHKVEHIT